LLFSLGAHVRTKATSTRAATRWRATHGGHGLGDVRRDGFLIDGPAFAFFTTTGQLASRRSVQRVLLILVVVLPAILLPATLTTLAVLLLTLSLTTTTVVAALALAQATTRSRRRDWTGVAE